MKDVNEFPQVGVLAANIDLKMTIPSFNGIIVSRQTINNSIPHIPYGMKKGWFLSAFLELKATNICVFKIINYRLSNIRHSFRESLKHFNSLIYRYKCDSRKHSNINIKIWIVLVTILKSIFLYFTINGLTQMIEAPFNLNIREYTL
uniref:Uncharacterized protein n=1 Tax=Lepeophtheirus salmonis TaxID=72036 RepID=A0A0K2UQK0_LEPSM